MKASNVSKAAALALAVAFAAGCSNTEVQESAETTAADNTSVAETAPATVNTAVSEAEMKAKAAAEAAALQSVFYFDFDQSVVKQDGFAALEKHAAYLAMNSDASVRLEGHADERGTREYNMALGEDRAKAVARVLQVNGVNAAQIETISYGEEKPAMMGHNADSWAKNRRVVLKYVSH
ncbi:MAG: peptidoglycan-associated lipoprotein Pal [Pontibacterium sp.]